MFATDFLFDGQRASDFGCMICSFNGNVGVETAEGGEIEYNAVKTPCRNELMFYGSQFNTTITWKFSICKNLCKKGNYYFDQYEESMIKKWLVKTDGYRMMQFDQGGYEDIYYNVHFNISTHQFLGKTIGFDLTAISDCPYGFTGIIKKKAIINSMSKLELNKIAVRWPAKAMAYRFSFFITKQWKASPKSSIVKSPQSTIKQDRPSHCL